MKIEQQTWLPPKYPTAPLMTASEWKAKQSGGAPVEPAEPTEQAILGGRTEEPKKGLFGRFLGKAKSKVKSVKSKLKTVTEVAGLVTAGLVPMARPLLEYGLGKLTKAGRADERPLAVWLNEEHADSVQVAAGNVLTKVSPKMEEGLGLNPQELIEAQKTLHDILAPEKTIAGKQVPQWMKKMATKPRQDALGKLAEKDPMRARELQSTVDSLSPFPSFVFLGEGQRHLADKISQDFDKSLDPAAHNPYKGTPAERVWNTLAEQAKKKDKLPVYVSRDGTMGDMDSTDNIVAATISSLAKRSNHHGDTFVQPTHLFEHLTARTEAYYHEIQPWIQRQDPELAQTADKIKSNMEPVKIGATENAVRKLFSGSEVSPRFWAADKDKVNKGHELFMSVATPAGKDNADIDSMCQLADLVTSLDRDLVTGVQSEWVRMAKNLDSEQVEAMFKPLAKAWVTLNTLDPSHPKFHKVSPDNAPSPKEFSKHPFVRNSGGQEAPTRYDRSEALGQGIDNLLDGLGVDARKDFLAILKTEIKGAESALIERDDQLRSAIPSFHGTHPESAIRGHLAIEGLVEPLSVLFDRSIGRGDRLQGQPGTTEEVKTMARRHASLMDWTVGHQNRYNTVESQISQKLLNEIEQTGDGSLMVSEFYQGIGDLHYTPLNTKPKERKVLGQGEGEMEVSVVLEGGGGKGLAYIENLRQMEANFDSSQEGQFAITEYVGTSAGSLMAGLMAAGFSVDELEDVMNQLNFEEFYSDYIWKQGGIDPKARGINRGGMFSMQEMYKTLQGLMAKKLGVEGRPVLMSDLPHKFKAVTTVLNTDLPEDHPMRGQIDKDGQLVYNTEDHPNMDAVGAMLASSAFPFFFDPPQMLEVGPGGEFLSSEVHRIQNVDGGALNNFPVGEAAGDEQTVMVVQPTRYTGMSTLNFAPDQATRDAVNRENRELSELHGAATIRTLNEARRQGATKLVWGLNLASEEEQAKPILQGRTKQETAGLAQIAQDNDMNLTDAKSAQELMEKMAGKDSKFKSLARKIATRALHGKEGSLHKEGYRPATEEAQGLEDVVTGLGGAVLWKGGPHRLFQQEEAS